MDEIHWIELWVADIRLNLPQDMLIEGSILELTGGVSFKFDNIAAGLQRYICNHAKDQILNYLFRVSGGCGDPSYMYMRTSQMKTLENIEYIFIPGGALVAATISDSSSIWAFNAHINSFSAISAYHHIIKMWQSCIFRDTRFGHVLFQ